MGDFIADVLGWFIGEFFLAPLFRLIWRAVTALWRFIIAGIASIFNRDRSAPN